jgi:hypothetical protein
VTRRAEGRTPPRSVDEALRRSAAHGRNALAEALLAAQALLDATALGLTGRAAVDRDEGAAGGPLASLSARIDDLVDRVRGEAGPLPETLAQAILDALEAEIARWEARARDDRDARAVLRAFLGLREILWELGVRNAREPAAAREPAPDADGDAGAPADRTRRTTRARTAEAGGDVRSGGGRPARVQRIEVED